MVHLVDPCFGNPPHIPVGSITGHEDIRGTGSFNGLPAKIQCLFKTAVNIKDTPRVEGNAVSHIIAGAGGCFHPHKVQRRIKFGNEHIAAVIIRNQMILPEIGYFHKIPAHIGITGRSKHHILQYITPETTVFPDDIPYLLRFVAVNHILFNRDDLRFGLVNARHQHTHRRTGKSGVGDHIFFPVVSEIFSRRIFREMNRCGHVSREGYTHNFSIQQCFHQISIQHRPVFAVGIRIVKQLVGEHIFFFPVGFLVGFVGKGLLNETQQNIRRFDL